MSKQSQYLVKTNKRNTRRGHEIDPKPVIQTPERHFWHYSVAIIVNSIPISHPAAVSPCRLRADKCRYSRYLQYLWYLVALVIKQNLRILTVKLISDSQTKFMYLKLDTKSLQSFPGTYVYQVSISLFCF